MGETTPIIDVGAKNMLTTVNESISALIENHLNKSIDKCRYLSFHANQVKDEFKKLDDISQKNKKGGSIAIQLDATDMNAHYSSMLNIPDKISSDKCKRTKRLTTSTTNRIADPKIKGIATKIKLYADYIEKEKKLLTRVKSSLETISKSIVKAIKDIDKLNDSVRNIQMPSGEDLTKLFNEKNPETKKANVSGTVPDPNL